MKMLKKYKNKINIRKSSKLIILPVMVLLILIVNYYYLYDGLIFMIKKLGNIQSNF